MLYSNDFILDTPRLNCYRLDMKNRIEEIKRRYNELRAQGIRGERLYLIIQKEFGDIAPSTIRAYATGKQFQRPTSLEVDPTSPSKSTYIQLPSRLFEKADIVARRSGLTLDGLIISLLTNHILEYQEAALKKQIREPSNEEEEPHDFD